MHIFIIIIHLFVCFALIGIVLLQTGKGASMGAMFGGAGNQTLFGSTGASTFLGKATTAAAIVFMLTSLSLAYISKSGDKSVVEDFKPASEQSMPADQLPAAPTGQTLPEASDPGDQGPDNNGNQTAR